MSRKNNVNPGQYYVGGRLRPDDIAGERMRQQKQIATSSRSEGRRGKAPTPKGRTK